MREFGHRCTRCLKAHEKMMILPIMGCMMMLCGDCAVNLLKNGVIPPKTKAKIVKLKKKGGE